jgi:Chaperone of endosialidase
MMRSTQSRLWAAAVLALAAGLLAAPATAGPAAVAAASVSPLGIHFQPSVVYEKLTLTVSGPEGLILRREFAAGASAMFEAVGDDGKPLPDGAYTYELVAAPVLDRATRRALAAARQSGDDSAVAKLQAAGRLPRTPMIQSGAFRIAGGTLVQDDAKEPSGGNGSVQTKGLTPTTAADQVIPDDLIVQGSECVGLDCVNNENFGFDTIRMKENNTRIHFDDTSTSAGFPANDWRLIANDSASGGSSKFSIEDSTGAKTPFTITAGAATNSIFVDSTGRVGLRTSTPVLDLHINTSNTPAMRLEQNNSGGFTAQTWDIAGNEANFFVRDVTGGSRLPFRIRPGAPTSSIDISADGDVGIGTASPDEALDIDRGTGASANFKVQGDSAGYRIKDLNGPVDQKEAQFFVNDSLARLRGLTDAAAEGARGITLDLADGDFAIGCSSNLTFDLTIGSAANCLTAPGSNINAGSTGFTATSSRTLKENLAPIQIGGILEKIANIGVYKYDFIAGQKDLIGLMAEDFHQLFQHGSDKLLNGQEVDMALWLAVQELTARNQQLTAQVAALTELTTRLAKLEAALTAQTPAGK